ncbi:MAG: DUF2156 domain-containing protein [Oscillospiraceae bacterium]|nr:DUF2156 domain-containing protein [Oscillospiraceae bacterium]
MIDFQRLNLSQKEKYEAVLFSCPPRGCEYSFANLVLWGRQEAAFLHGCVAFFAHFYGRSVYPYPIGNGDRRAVLEEILLDAKERGIPCRLTGLTETDRAELAEWFPDRFLIRSSRDGFDYVYAIDDLADLKGRKFQKKRNHVNRFRAEHPLYEVVPLTVCNMPLAQHMVNDWYHKRMKEDPEGDYLLENLALARACRNYTALGMEGILLMDGGEVLAVTMGSRLSPDTFDIHFEKAREDVDGAYTAVNQEFARYLRLKYPEAAYLDREDDMGLEGLRKAKLSYNPHHLIEKYQATLSEDLYDL